jgi:hypothetical protein
MLPRRHQQECKIPPINKLLSLPLKAAALGLSNLKKRLEEIEKERLAFNAEKLALDDKVST